MATLPASSSTTFFTGNGARATSRTVAPFIVCTTTRDSISSSTVSWAGSDILQRKLRVFPPSRAVRQLRLSLTANALIQEAPTDINSDGFFSREKGNRRRGKRLKEQLSRDSFDDLSGSTESPEKVPPSHASGPLHHDDDLGKVLGELLSFEFVDVPESQPGTSLGQQPSGDRNNGTALGKLQQLLEGPLSGDSSLRGYKASKTNEDSMDDTEQQPSELDASTNDAEHRGNTFSGTPGPAAVRAPPSPAASKGVAGDTLRPEGDPLGRKVLGKAVTRWLSSAASAMARDLVAAEVAGREVGMPTSSLGVVELAREYLRR